MPVIIRNITRPTRKTGEHLYSLSVNDQLVTTFVHRREEPLHVLLSRAAVAAEKALTPNDGAV